MATTIGSTYLPSYLNIASSAYSSASTATPSATQSQTQSSNGATDGPASTVALSDAAQAFLAGLSDANAPEVPLATTVADARAWFDDQYKTLNVTSALKDGKATVDLSKQSRAMLIAIASNTDGKFTADEKKVASDEMVKRFSAAVTPYIAIARQTGNYISLYQAASDYLDQAGADERATKSWQDAKKAVSDALAAVKKDPSKAPDAGGANDPVMALLNKRTATGSLAFDASASDVAKDARAALDDQANAAIDDGTELTFDPTDKNGKLVDFSQFDNRELAVVALNTDKLFSDEEARSARLELNKRTRDQMMGVLNSDGSNAAQQNLGLIGAYENMSDEEKSVLGVTKAVTDRLVQNFQTMQSLANVFANANSLTGNGMLGISALLGAQQTGSFDSSDPSMIGLAGLM